MAMRTQMASVPASLSVQILVSEDVGAAGGGNRDPELARVGNVAGNRV